MCLKNNSSTGALEVKTCKEFCTNKNSFEICGKGCGNTKKYNSNQIETIEGDFISNGEERYKKLVKKTLEYYY